MNEKTESAQCSSSVVVIPAGQVSGKSGSRKKRLRVAAYCRVSTDEERQIDSFENQVEHYEQLIAHDSRYELVKVYSDEGISGCSTRSRKGFRAMIDDCEKGLIDLIITKSISRFARNTQDSLNYTRRLREMGIGIIFEKEGINTMESSGELLLTLFSCFAQEESRSISENTAWGIRSRFRQGIPHLNTEVLLGYDKDEYGNLVINEYQADTVRLVYRLYMEGWPLTQIAGELNRRQLPGVHGEPKWCAVTISRMLRNEKYRGALLMQKTYTANYLTRQHFKNTGQFDQYYIEFHHPAIIDPEEWDAVQQEIERRKVFRETHGLRGLSSSGGSNGGSAFYAKLFCSDCGCKMQRIYRKGVKLPYWQCTYCQLRVEDRDLRARFCKAFNSIIDRRTDLLSKWERIQADGTALQKLRARQMAEITAGGSIPYEIPELTRAVLQEARLAPDGSIHITFASGDEVSV